MFGQNLKKLRTSKKSAILVKIVWSGNLLPCSYIPIVLLDIPKIADFFDVSTDYLLGRNPQNPPTEFNNATDAMEFILKLPTVMAYGGYDATKLSDEEIIDFANDLLQQIELISYKYKKK